ncbi:hypothetical protein GDO86_003901 [Hymenochirus boettgeri]|uniref:DNA repair protein REV1 n=1 Tax=Hymenochirus boettgeri TaxID=247094 RepID=A0A8T2KBK4_9PIPI|nr:hypothetical protein GDO86_003901 [Hymenochirus boettgeri]
MRQGGWWNRASEKDGWGAWGGYMAAKVQKLDEQFQSDAPVQQNKGGTSSKIFHGISIYVNGYTDPSADHLRHLMMLHGGQYHLYYSRSKTTHIIATNLPNNKIKELKDEKVVRPEWIMESIKAGHLLSYVPYQLYTKQSSVQKRLNFTFMHNSNDAAPGPSNITRELVHDTNHTTKEFPLQSSISRPNGVSGWEEDDDEHKDDLTLWDSNQVFSKHKPNGLQSHKGNKAVCSKYSCNSNGALKSLDNTVHSSNSFPDKHCSLPQQEIPSPGTDLSVEQLQSIGKESDAYYNPQRTVSTSPLPSSSHLHSNLKVNGAHRSLTECSSTNSTMNSLTKLNSPQLPKTTDPNFISDFYSHSRLHHISTWKCEFTEFVRSLQTQSTGACPGRERLKKLTGKTISAVRKCQNCIIHVDMDCFFVSVAIRNRADLKGKPVAVTSNRGGGTIMNREGTNPQLEFQYYQNRILKGKSEITDVQEQSTSGSTEKNVLALDISHLSLAEIASCSYEARQAGVKNGMFFGKAKQICPDLQAVPYDFESYKEVAMAMYKTLASYTRDIEAVSCDEALADITGIIVETKLTPDEVANAIRMEIKEKTGCAASIGMGSNILLARMATRKAKPDGQYHLKPEEVDDFIRDQPVNNLPGVGRSMEYKLSSLGVKTCGDLQSITMSNLQKEFGPKTGQMLYRFCRGLDDRPIQKEKERKSVSAEINYGIRFTQQSEAEAFLFNLSEEIQRRLEAAGVKGKKLTLKIMVRKAGAPIESAKYGGHGICDNVARSVTLDQATDCAKVIGKEAVDMFHTMKLNISDMRGIGLQVHQLVSVQRSCNYGSTALKSCALPGGSRSLMNMFQGKRIKKISEEDDKKGIFEIFHFLNC